MARFGVNNTLANPAYMGGLFEAARGVGASSGNRREREAKKRAAEEMNSMGSTMGMLQYQVQNAKTPEEAMKAQMLLENFKDLETNRSTAVEDRQFRKADRATAEAERTRGLAQEQAKARISVLENEAKRLKDAGQTEAARNLEVAIGKIAAENGIEVEATESLDPSKRYMNVGEGQIFDALEGKYLENPTKAQKEEAGPELSPKDFLSNIRQEQKDTERWKSEAYQSFLTNIPKEGVYASAKKYLTEDNMVDFGKQRASASSDLMNDAVDKMGLIDDLLGKAPDMDPEGGMGNVARGVYQQLFSNLGGTQAKEIETMTKTLSANEAFGSLQKMRDNSKTGGALGSISERELDLLMSDARNLDPSSPNFKEALQVIKRKYQRVLDIEMGPAGGSDNYVKGDNGEILYVDPVSKIIYDYKSGDPDPRYN